MGIFDWLFGIGNQNDIEKKSRKSLDFELDISRYPESSIKDISELDDEKQKKMMDITIFIDKYGRFDETRGQAKTLLRALKFILKVKGVKLKNIDFDIATFLIFSDEFPPVTDIDGKWHVKLGNMIVKSFSDDKFEPALLELLKANEIDKDLITCGIDLHTKKTEEFYKGDGFKIYVHDEMKPKMISIVTSKKFAKQSLSYIHIEGKGIWNL
tara:strand:+ start:198 stop:833 length:636 start_codon:yes stop_codon:yes gene_type:complete